MNVINVVNIGENMGIRHAIRDRYNPLEEFAELEFQTRFRFKKKKKHHIPFASRKSTSFFCQNNFVPPILQLATALRF